MFSLFEIFVSLFQWHACKLAKRDAYTASRIATISNISHTPLGAIVKLTAAS